MVRQKIDNFIKLYGQLGGIKLWDMIYNQYADFAAMVKGALGISIGGSATNVLNQQGNWIPNDTTHTGEVTGSVALVLDKTAITNQSIVTAVGTDYALVSDTSDSGNLKKVLVSDFSGGGGAWGSITGTLSAQTDLQTALDGKVDENSPITGDTKTKITYDAKGLVTSGANATTADISDSTNKRYVTDAELVVIGNTSGTNTGDNAVNSLYANCLTQQQVEGII